MIEKEPPFVREVCCACGDKCDWKRRYCVKCIRKLWNENSLIAHPHETRKKKREYSRRWRKLHPGYVGKRANVWGKTHRHQMREVSRRYDGARSWFRKMFSKGGKWLWEQG